MGQHPLTPNGTKNMTRRCLDRNQAAEYLSVSTRSIDRLIEVGKLHVVRLPVERDQLTQGGKVGSSRKILLDVKDLDQLVEDSKTP